ncbi:flavin-containing monooxygenase [Rhodococcus sp. NPDC056960]|uniref:flavin-containing monooxygenase n=1 Tax=Rhodococcus sp. NPDC056960 TaxID=3345982 RepID=UPI0036327C36
MTSTNRLPEPPTLREADDGFLTSVVEEAELPALLCALAFLTGDLSLVQHDARPPAGPLGAVVPTQAGMTSDTQQKAKVIAVKGLRTLRDEGATPLDLEDENNLRTLMSFITGDVDDAYMPLMTHELGYPHDVGKPSWHTSDYPDLPTRRVAVVGAGMSGMLAAHRLRQAGHEVTVFEKNRDIGGTWLENSYPGCRLDTTNFGYSYSFAQVSDWPQQYSPQGAILEYFRKVAGDLKLREMIRFGVEVTRMVFQEDTGSWLVSTVGNEHTDTLEFDVVISAVGQLNRPNIPDFVGLGAFGGPVVHTARWDHSLDLSGKRVVVIGTGASAFQAIPHLAETAHQVSILQRTPPWMLPAADYQSAIAPGLAWLLEHVDHYNRWYRFQQFWMTMEGRRAYVQVDPQWKSDFSVSSLNDELRVTLEAYIRGQFADRPDLLAHVVPDYPPGAKRMLRDDGTWARTLKRSNVSLITEGVDRFECKGVRTTDGTLHEADVVVLGTGFRASEFFMPMEVVGRGGIDIHSSFGTDVRAYIGITIPNFPNFFSLYGPNTNLVVNGSTILFSEMGAEYILECLHLLHESGLQSIEVKPDVFEKYNERIDAANAEMAWGASGVNSWYKSASGRISQNWPLSMLDYWKFTHDANPDHYLFAVGAQAETSIV